jgi:hypothetical protein
VVQRRGLGRFPCGLQAAQIWRLRSGRPRLTTDPLPQAPCSSRDRPQAGGRTSHRPTLTGQRAGSPDWRIPRPRRPDCRGLHSFRRGTWRWPRVTLPAPMLVVVTAVFCGVGGLAGLAQRPDRRSCRGRAFGSPQSDWAGRPPVSCRCKGRGSRGSG